MPSPTRGRAAGCGLFVGGGVVYAVERGLGGEATGNAAVVAASMTSSVIAASTTATVVAVSTVAAVVTVRAIAVACGLLCSGWVG